MLVVHATSARALVQRGVLAGVLLALGCTPGLRMTAVEIEGMDVASTRVLAHRDGCAAPVPYDALRIDGPALPRLSAGAWTVVVEGANECEVIARGCVEARLPSAEPLRVTLRPVEPIPIGCAAGFACRAGACLCEREPCRAVGCGDLDEAGHCDGDTLVWCDRAREPLGRKEVDCARTGRTCGWASTEIGFTCLGPPEPSEPLTLREIVGGADYEILQPYGPGEYATEHADHYAYCAGYGNPPDVPVHCGLDLGLPRETPLYAPANAIVTMAGATGTFGDEEGGAGDLRFALPDGTRIIYGYTARVDVWRDQVVAAGDPVGASGSFDGPRLHLEVRVPDPTTELGFRTLDPLELFER